MDQIFATADINRMVGILEGFIYFPLFGMIVMILASVGRKWSCNFSDNRVRHAKNQFGLIVTLVPTVIVLVKLGPSVVWQVLKIEWDRFTGSAVPVSVISDLTVVMIPLLVLYAIANTLYIAKTPLVGDNRRRLNGKIYTPKGKLVPEKPVFTKLDFDTLDHEGWINLFFEAMLQYQHAPLELTESIDELIEVMANSRDARTSLSRFRHIWVEFAANAPTKLVDGAVSEYLTHYTLPVA